MERWESGNSGAKPSGLIDQEPELAHSHESKEAPLDFFDAIGRPDLHEKITPETPWIYSTMEIYHPPDIRGVKGGGGLGMLASDTQEVLIRENIPAVFYTLFYAEEAHQRIENFEQVIDHIPVTPEQRGMKKTAEVTVTTLIDGRPTPTTLDVYAKQRGSVLEVSFHEPSIGSLYQGRNDDDHRLYQEIALGFGEAQMNKKLGIKAAMHQLNESPTVFSALARLDELVEETGDLETALALTRAETIYTNHTLVQAAEGGFSGDQFERFVLPNLRSEAVREWTRNKIQACGGVLKLSLLAIELSGVKNGVSQLHAREASKTYRDLHGNPVRFEGVTNGISLARWGDPQLLELYKTHGVLDEFDLPTNDFREKLDKLDKTRLEQLKELERKQLRSDLETHLDQYGQPVTIPDGAKVYSWRRRIAGYKRPEMLFERPEELARILEEDNAHIVMAGRAHQTDRPMQEKLTEILKIIDSNPVLKARAHFVQNYDEPLACSLARGADMALNTPTTRNGNGEMISTEACGTSIFKDMLGNTILISTDDGGVADARIRAEREGVSDFTPPYLEITGETYQEELDSLYAQMRQASRIINDGNRITHTIEQLKEYLPVISGERMIQDYLEMTFPKE